MKNFVVEATVLPHVLNKNVHILCKIRPKVALESVFKNRDITEKMKWSTKYKCSSTIKLK